MGITIYSAHSKFVIISFFHRKKLTYLWFSRVSPLMLTVDLPNNTKVALANHQRGTVPRCEVWHGRIGNCRLLAMPTPCTSHQFIGKRICRMHVRPNYLLPPTGIIRPHGMFLPPAGYSVSPELGSDILPSVTQILHLPPYATCLVVYIEPWRLSYVLYAA
jgi:hypothetical protein